jgi:hypothetical protein
MAPGKIVRMFESQKTFDAYVSSAYPLREYFLQTLFDLPKLLFSIHVCDDHDIGIFECRQRGQNLFQVTKPCWVIVKSDGNQGITMES